MRKLIISAVIGLTALTGQAFAKQTGAAVATQVGSRVSGQSADANQLAGMGLGIIPIVVIAAGVIAIIATSNNDDKYKICSSSGC